jgi:hypothetical protein
MTFLHFFLSNSFLEGICYQIWFHMLHKQHYLGQQFIKLCFAEPVIVMNLLLLHQAELIIYFVSN